MWSFTTRFKLRGTGKYVNKKTLTTELCEGSDKYKIESDQSVIMKKISARENVRLVQDVIDGCELECIYLLCNGPIA